MSNIIYVYVKYIYLTKNKSRIYEELLNFNNKKKIQNKNGKKAIYKRKHTTGQ